VVLSSQFPRHRPVIWPPLSRLKTRSFGSGPVRLLLDVFIEPLLMCSRKRVRDFRIRPFLAVASSCLWLPFFVRVGSLATSCFTSAVQFSEERDIFGTASLFPFVEEAALFFSFLLLFFISIAAFPAGNRTTIGPRSARYSLLRCVVRVPLLSS